MASQALKQLPVKNHLRTIYNVGVSEREQISFLPVGKGTWKGESKMRKYKCSGELEAVICNACGRKLVVKNGIVREGVLMIDHAWDYFSEKDGEVHHLDLCEECYDTMLGTLKIPADVEEATEMI